MSKLALVPADAGDTAVDWIHNADAEVLACRGQRHRFPKIKTDRRGQFPKGISSRRQHDGSSRIESTCPDCGTVRWLVTSPAGVFDEAAGWSYKYDRRYRAPVRVHPRACLSETIRRAVEDGALSELEAAG